MSAKEIPVAKSDYRAKWTTEKEIVKSCGKKTCTNMVIHMPYSVWALVQAMCDKMPTQEWLGYLVGDLETRTITNLVIPKQVVGGANVDVDPEAPIPPNMVGTIHSHNSMGAFFSGTDDESICSNHPLSIVVNNKGEYSARVNVALPCGSEFSDSAKLDIQFPQVSTSDFVTEATKSISTRKAYQSVQTDNYYHGNTCGASFAPKAQMVDTVLYKFLDIGKVSYRYDTELNSWAEWWRWGDFTQGYWKGCNKPAGVSVSRTFNTETHKWTNEILMSEKEQDDRDTPPSKSKGNYVMVLGKGYLPAEFALFYDEGGKMLGLEDLPVGTRTEFASEGYYERVVGVGYVPCEVVDELDKAGIISMEWAEPDTDELEALDRETGEVVPRFDAEALVETP